MNNIYKKFKLIRPIPPGYEIDNIDGIPTIKKENIEVDWNEISFETFSNISSVKNRKESCLSFFQYDDSFERVWNNPERYISKLKEFGIVVTPDFSAYRNMAPIEIGHNIYKNRWLGCFWQYFGINVIPSVTWADERTYDICFKGIETNSIIMISTIGVSNDAELFLKGFNEMMKRIEPSLIIVRGKMIRGMKGNFIFVDFDDTFNVKRKYEKIELFHFDRIVTLEEEI